jgi:hypothetical protein
MAVSEPLRLGDKLREALADAQHVLESTDLRGKVKLEVTTSGGSTAAGVDATIDRTEADAKKAAEGGGGGGAVGVLDSPLSPSNKLIDAMEKLIKAMDGVPDALDKPGRRRGRRPAGEAPSEDEGPAPGYMNPYILQGLVQNPLGTMRGMGTSMMMGGSGMGMKPPSWLNDALGGTSGTFNVGRALGASTLGGEAGATAFMGTGTIAAAGIGTLLASFWETLKIETNAAKDRAQDANARVGDYRFGNAQGIDWRAGAWAGFHQSRSDIDSGDIKELIQSSGVGYKGMFGRVSWQMMGGFEAGGLGGMQSAVNSALNIGISPGQMGGLLGAATRTGTLDMNAANGSDQLLRYLGLIEQWTGKAANYGLSSAEALQQLASDNQAQAASAHGIVTMGASRALTSLRENLQGAMPAGMERTGTNIVEGFLGAPAGSDTLKAMQANQFLGNGEDLSPEGEEMANKALGPQVVADMKARYGKAAGAMIAYAASQSDLGNKWSKQGVLRSFGGNTLGAAALTGGDVVGTAVTMEHGLGRGLFTDVTGQGIGGTEDRPSAHSMREGGGTATERAAEIELRRQAGVDTVRSGMDAKFATSVLAFDKAVENFNRGVVQTLTSGSGKTPASQMVDDAIAQGWIGR